MFHFIVKKWNWMLLLVVLLLRAPQNWREKKKLKQNEWNWKKIIWKYRWYRFIYIVNGENHSAISLIWYLLSVIILSICFVCLIRFFLFFRPIATVFRIFSLYIDIDLIFIWTFSKAILACCWSILYYACVQNPITTKYFVLYFWK